MTKKMGRPKVPANKKLINRTIALSREELDFIANQTVNGSVYVRSLIRKAMKEAVNNDDK